jgi:hypothetical protein
VAESLYQHRELSSHAGRNNFNNYNGNHDTPLSKDAYLFRPPQLQPGDCWTESSIHLGLRSALNSASAFQAEILDSGNSWGGASRRKAAARTLTELVRLLLLPLLFSVSSAVLRVFPAPWTSHKHQAPTAHDQLINRTPPHLHLKPNTGRLPQRIAPYLEITIPNTDASFAIVV